MIKVQNIYYMLSYAYQVLQEKGYKEIGEEDFSNALELLLEILIKGVKSQIKTGLLRNYLQIEEPTSVVKGKINITETVRNNLLEKHKVDCSFEDFSLNTRFNQILKTTFFYLLHSDICLEKKKEIRLLIVYFPEVDILSPDSIDWNARFDRTNQTYRMLMAICNMILDGMVISPNSGNQKMKNFVDEQRMCHLYEKFILEFYRKHYPSLNANPSEVKWALDDENDYLLPGMITDISLTKGNQVLIIDAKFYGSNLQTRYDKASIISGNLYQIFTYVKNKSEEGKEVSGMLLYAKTEDGNVPDVDYQMSGNKISIRSLNLSGDFSFIDQKLREIAEQM